MIARPPTTAKSTPLLARSANSFSNREIVSFDSGEGSWGIFSNEVNHVFNATQVLTRSQRATDRLAHALLHWLNLDVHEQKLSALSSTVNCRICAAVEIEPLSRTAIQSRA